MTAIHVEVRPRPNSAPLPELAPLYGLFDVIVDGVNVTARIGEGQALALLADLGEATADLLAGRRSRATVPLYSDEEVWELGLEADGPDALVTVYKTGPHPEVAVHERRVSLKALRQGIAEGLANVRETKAPRAIRDTLVAARGSLERLAKTAPIPQRRVARAEITPRAVRGFAFRAEATLRLGPLSAAGPASSLERSDLHALLYVGSLGIVSQGKSTSIANASLVLVSERLVELAQEVLEAAQAARPLFRRVQVGTVRLGVRLGNDQRTLAFSLGSAAKGATSALTFPELDPNHFAQSVVLLVRALREAIIEADPEQRRNLRLTALHQNGNRLAERAQPVEQDAALTNPNPEEFRRFASEGPLSPEGRWSHGGQMRFVPRWMATVPNIDLASTLLCGERLVVTAARETTCLDRATGEELWHIATPRAGALATPSGVVRIHPDGRLALHELDTGKQRFSLKLTPRASGGASGAVIHAPGLPRLLAVAEGDRRITAIDLVSGEIKWRYSARRPAPLRVRRAGRLLLVAGGDSVLAALDATSGETIWRACERLPFSGDISVVGDDVFALSAGAQGGGRLHRFDAWTGELRYSAQLGDRPLLGQAPIVTDSIVVVPVRDARGQGARAFDRETGVELWALEPGFLPRATAWLGLDDSIIANTAHGMLYCIEAATSALRYTHAFSQGLEADQPRRLEPVVRGGALFVPQQQIQVLRPRDGAQLGTVPTDLVPDLMRVDDQCSVYVAEESGHIGSFSVAPVLVRIK